LTRLLRAWGAAVAASILVLAAPAVHAQGISPGPPGPFVIDLRGVTTTVPTGRQFYPIVDEEDDEGEEVTLTVPGRGYGFDVGAHVYPFRLGPARIGFGLSFGRARATAVSGQPADADSSDQNGGDDDEEDEVPTPVDVVLTAQTLAPQVSFNFGTANGWSYLSAGYGRAAVRTRVGAEERETNGLTALNFGGGARWFFTDHLGVGFDVRWHKVGAGETTPATTMFAAVVGLSVK
jgi:hypothetical protein